MDSERAERYLRLAAEAALRRARALPGHDGDIQPRDIFTECIGRLDRIAAVLIATGAIGADQAKAITDPFRLALGVRHLHPITAGPPFRRSLRSQNPAVAQPPRPEPSRPGPEGPPATGSALGAAQPQVIPVGRMLPFRDENLTGELYVMSLVLTAAQAIAPVAVRVRSLAHGAGHPALRWHFPPSVALTAADNQGTTYHAGFSGGGGAPGRWAGHLRIEPAPSPGARWLELSFAGQPGVRIGLTSPAGACAATVEPRTGAPGEHVLDGVAQHVLADAADNPGLAHHTARNLGDAIAALEAAGALSPFSATPGHLATVCERLGIDQHGITARPTADLPEPWLSVLAAHGRRHRLPARDGTAALALALPGLDGARIVLAGLQTIDDRTSLYVFGCGLPPAWSPNRSGPGPHPALGWWLRDDAGHWHVAVLRQWAEDVHGEALITLQVWPPLGRETADSTLFVSTPTSQVGVRVPLSWWASP